MSSTDKTSSRSLSDKAMEMVRERIFALEFSPGERLVVDKLAEDLQVSRTPIREGLRLLVQQGLVTYDGKGYSIFHPTAKDVEEILVLRQTMESLAARLAAENMPENEINRLRVLWKEYKEYNKDSSRKAMGVVDFQFHDAILKGADNGRLERIVADMRGQFRLIRSWMADNLHAGPINQETIEEHIKVLECIAARDSQGAYTAMAEHIEKSRKRTIHNLFDRNLVFR